MRGEHCGISPSAVNSWGSSPHARGTLCDIGESVMRTRIIPACAGNTWPVNSSSIKVEDHPRMRGEHQSNIKPLPATGGSSPHARGTPCRPRPGRDPPGIIPACAGNTESLTLILIGRRDHPRMRGEHSSFGSVLVVCWGSSPHARGTLAVSRLPGLPGGIIPACAGNTALTLTMRTRWRDHPRMRGEHVRR